MTRILFTTLALHTLIGCGDVGNTPELTLSLDTAGLEQDERTDDADTVYSLLNGNFDSLRPGQRRPRILPGVPAVV